ncbi:Glycoside hydrolase family 47 [Penicillium angulare]|uniref:alpha-1,2-Mannosidase n=1 Tax=Penicillium angulare TaxID=116970 RepID=A0A9W9KL06_9EURO|nr:Glycoside hydrolase family 47 [Penicillium angulare]
MFRARRYRVLLVFAAAFVLAFLHFARSRDWSDTTVVKPSTQAPKPNSGSPGYPKPDPQAGTNQPPTKPVLEDGAGRFAPAKPDYESENGKTSNDGYSSGKGTVAEDKSSKYTTPGSSGKQDQTWSSDKGSSAIDETNPAYLAEELDTGGSGRSSAKHTEAGTTPAQWKKFPERFPVPAAQLIKLPKDRATSVSKLQAKFKDESSADKQERMQQLSTIRAEFNRAWLAYKKAAMGHDELKPLTGGFEDPFNGWGATLVDALDTLYIMDLKEEFAEAVDAVKKIDFTTSAREDIPVFETVIRYLGGLLGAYDISGQRYPELLEKAQELAEVLIGAFDTPNRMPVLYYRWTPDHVIRRHRASGKAALAEIGSLSLEFTRLAQLTQEDKYYDAIARITNELEQLQDETTIPGLWPMRVNAQGCAKYKPSQQVNRGVGSPSQEEPRSELDTYLNTPSETKNNTESKTVPRKHYSAPTDVNSYLNLMSRDVSDDFSQSEPANYHQGSTALDTEAQLEQEYNCNSGLLMPTSYRENKYTMGGMADSTYEYLPKEYLLLGGANDQYKSMYKKAIDAARKNLLFRPMIKGERDIRFMASTSTLEMGRKNLDISTSLIHESHHLTCFVGGMVAVGAKAFGIPGDMELAAKLTDGCVWAYESTTTGIMPERFRVLPCAKDKTCEWDQARYDAEITQYGHVRDSAAAAQYRSGESTYGQRVKMNSDWKPQDIADSGMAVPFPMPGSLNPHDKDPINKRDSFAVGRAAVSSTIPRPASPTGGFGDLEDRDAPRVSSPGPLSQTDRDYHLPTGMVSIPSSEYLLRPEAIESVFIMYRLTGDEIWRRKGWKMFEAITKHSRTELANAAISDVMSPKPAQKDSMESFWLAETLKYFYLLFSDPTVVDLDKYVLNTEAHPFQRPN